MYKRQTIKIGIKAIIVSGVRGPINLLTSKAKIRTQQATIFKKVLVRADCDLASEADDEGWATVFTVSSQCAAALRMAHS